MKTNMIKKTLSLLLCAVMLICAVPFMSFAADYSNFERYTADSGITYYLFPDGTAEVADCPYETAGAVTIPGEINGHKVVGFTSEAFAHCTKVTEVSIPDGVTYINERAFFDCASLKKVNIPDGVVSIGMAAFYCCPELKQVTIPASDETIEEYAFGYYMYGSFLVTMDNMIIYGQPGSAAEEYANANSLKFKDANKASSSDGFFARIKAFFDRIIEWLRSLFVK